LVREIHTRMPVILPEDRFDVWLSGEAGKEILVPYPADQMTVWPISARVNSPKNDDAGILEPIAVEAQARRPDA
jgi:putative SOS response-associated peptidase YedK